MSDKRKIIGNDENVVAYTTKGTMVEWKMGALKQAFIGKKLDYKLAFLFVPKRNKYFTVSYQPTKGFTYISYDPRKGEDE